MISPQGCTDAAAECPGRRPVGRRVAGAAGDAPGRARAPGAPGSHDPRHLAHGPVHGQGALPSPWCRRPARTRVEHGGDLVTVKEGKSTPTPATPPSATISSETSRRPSPSISAWIGQLARDESIDTALLGQSRPRGVPPWRSRRSAGQRVASRVARSRHPITDPGESGSDLRRPGSTAADPGRAMTPAPRCRPEARPTIGVFLIRSGTIQPQCQLSSVGALS